MPKPLYAEEIIALVAGRERAESIAGDLTEEAARRGTLWFGVSLAGVVFAMFFAASGRGRLRTLAALAAGLALWAGIYVAVRFGVALSGLGPIAAGARALPETLPASLAYLGAALAVSNFLTGLVLGRVRGSQHPSPVMLLAAFWCTVALVAFGADIAAGRPTWYCTLVYLAGVPCLYIAPLVVGGALAARRDAVVRAGVPR